MGNQVSSTKNILTKINEEYKNFLNQLGALKEKQKQLIEEYRKKLEQKKLSRLKKQLDLVK